MDPTRVDGGTQDQGQTRSSPNNATQPTANAAPQQRAAKLINEMDALLPSLLPSDEGAPCRKVWDELKDVVGELVRRVQTTVDNDQLRKLTDAVTTLVNKQKQLPNPPSISYAAALRAGLQTWTGPPPAREVPARLSRELVVAVPNASPQDRGRPIRQIVEEINKSKSSTIQGKVLAARRLPSGDVVVTTDTEDTKRQLEKDGSWLSAVGQAAQVNRRKFPVMVHGMKVSSVDCSNQKEAIRQIMGQNAQLQNRVEILRVQWPKRAAKLGKASSHLLLHLASPEQVNILVDEGLLFHSELRRCELYHGDCRVTQCFNCQKYGHIARICRFSKKCGLCAAPGHDDHACNFRNDSAKHRCANCGLQHPAWSSSCAVRREQVDKARLAYTTRPKRYASPPGKSGAPLAVPTADDFPSPPSQSSPQSSMELVPYSQEERMEGIQVGPVRATQGNLALGKRSRDGASEAAQDRRAPGRPPSTSRASQGSQPIAAYFSQNSAIHAWD
jgi:hypothetical protein